MKKVILVIPPQEKFTKDYLPSLGLAYIASSLEKAGYQVLVIDSHINNLNEEETVDRILSENPDVVGITANTHNRLKAISVCRGIKNKSLKNILICIGGCHFSPTAESTLKDIPEIDVVVRNEGEITMVDLLNHYFNNNSFDEVLGITFRSGNKVISNPQRPFIKNLDDLPSPAWYLFELDKYNARLEGQEGIRSIGISSSRGCPNNCVFCVNSYFWKRKLRRHSPKRFVDEVEFLNKNYGFEGFDFWDDTITMIRSHIVEICNEIIKRKLDIKWYARARVNTVDKELLSLMKKAGCVTISFGVESGSPKILKNIHKNITIEQVKNITKICSDLGLTVKLFFMYSLPGETIKDIQLTRDFMRELKFYGSNIHVVSAFTFIYPGTDVAFLANQSGFLKNDFNWSNPIEFEFNKKIRVNPTIPIFENKDLPVREIKKFLDSRYNRFINLLKSFYCGIKNIKNFKDIKNLLLRTIKYLKRKL